MTMQGPPPPPAPAPAPNSATLVITKKIENGAWTVDSSVGANSDIPSDIFLYVNDNGQPGDFVAICSLSDYLRFQTYTGTNIPAFGNKYLKKTTGHQILPISVDMASYIAGLLSAATGFRLQYLSLAAQDTHSYTI